MSLLRSLASRWPDSQVAGSGARAVLTSRIDDAPFRAVVVEGALVELDVDSIAVPGFTLTVTPRPPGGDPDDALEWASLSEYVDYRAARDRAGASVRATFLHRFAVASADRGLARLWLDDPARHAMLDAPERYHLDGGRLRVDPFAAIGLDGFERTMRAAARLATRPHRIAAAWRDALAGLGGGVASAEIWQPGDAFAITVELRGSSVVIDTPWHPESPDGDRLRTRVRARRVGATGDRWNLWRHTLDAAHRLPRIDDAAPVTLAEPLADRYGAWSSIPHLGVRLRPLSALIRDAAPDALAAAGEEISLWWRGMILDPRRLGPALELCARLAVEGGATTGPYR